MPVEEGMQLVAGYTLALDMTARDFQNEAKAKGHPWAMAKCFDTACPIGDFIPKEAVADPGDVRLLCRVNGETRQDGNTKDMVRSRSLEWRGVLSVLLLCGA